MKLSYRNQTNAKIISALYDKPLDKPEWFKVNAEASEEEVEILIYDVVGWPWMDANMLVNAMNEYKGKPLVFGINSPGGDVIDSIAIYQAMNRHDAKVTVRIDSLAASSASIIALGGEEVNAYKSSTFMIHNPWSIAIGNEFMMEEMKDVLKQYRLQITDIYSDKASIGKKEIKSLMDGKDKRDGTWMTAKDAKEKGFIDSIIEGKSKVKARMDIPIFAGIPDHIKISDSDENLTIRDAEKALHDRGFSKKRSRALLAGCQPENQWDAGRVNEINNLLKSIEA
jgi:ATP-dependent protease ClpP protease subunit